MPDQLRIIVEVDEVQLWGEEYPQEQGYDPYLSGQKFCDLVRGQITDRYPNAGTRIEYVDCGASDTHVCSFSHTVDDCQLAEMVINDIMDGVYNAHEWEVTTVEHTIPSPWV